VPHLQCSLRENPNFLQNIRSKNNTLKEKGSAWSSGLRHNSILKLPGRSWVQISAPPIHFLLDKMNNGAANNNRASNKNGVAEARSRKGKQTINGEKKEEILPYDFRVL
jgi:hypothetical protein